MKLAHNVVIAGAVIAAAVIVKKLVRSRRHAKITPAVTATEGGLAAPELRAEDLTAIATRSGIADVDPQYISHVAGEGIDLDRDVAAHEEILEQRERLPR
jgi:hypothetical protein